MPNDSYPNFSEVHSLNGQCPTGAVRSRLLFHLVKEPLLWILFDIVLVKFLPGI
jgi:hypothetical protein